MTNTDEEYDDEEYDEAPIEGPPADDFTGGATEKDEESSAPLTPPAPPQRKRAKSTKSKKRPAKAKVKAKAKTNASAGRKCAARGCDKTFTPKTAWQRYHTPACGSRERQRRIQARRRKALRDSGGAVD